MEKDSIERVEREGVWKGVTRGRIERVAREGVGRGEVVLRRGWRGLVADVQRRGGGGGGVGIVSVGWSRGFIEGCLREGGREGEGEGGGGDGGGTGVGKEEVDVDVDVGDIDVRANELVFDEEGRGTGGLDRYFSSEEKEEEEDDDKEEEEEEKGTGIWTAAAKFRVMRELIKKNTTRDDENGGVGGARPWVIYIGDSATDLGCLMEADVGVCVRDEGVETGEQRGLRDVLERCGVRCGHVGEWKGRGEGGDRDEGKGVWWARDFEEVRRGIFLEREGL